MRMHAILMDFRVLLVDPQGTLLASGSPERIIRLWDPRVGVATGGKSSAGGLVGHTDNVKALLMSEDGRYVSCSF